MYYIGSTFRTATLSLLQSTCLHSCPSCPFHFVTMPPLPRWTTAKSPGSFPWSGSCRATSAGDSTRRSSGWRRRKRPRPTRRNRPTSALVTAGLARSFARLCCVLSWCRKPRGKHRLLERKERGLEGPIVFLLSSSSLMG